MEDLKNNKLLWVVVVVTVLNLGGFAFRNVLLDKIADRVIEKLQKEYSPSPYGPGLDPDKVSPDSLQTKPIYLELRKKDQTSFLDSSADPAFEKIARDSAWRRQWEQELGAVPDAGY